MSRKTLEDFLCDSCGAEYTITYVEEDIMEEPLYCPFCSNELDTYDIEEEMQSEFEFDEE